MGMKTRTSRIILSSPLVLGAVWCCRDDAPPLVATDAAGETPASSSAATDDPPRADGNAPPSTPAGSSESLTGDVPLTRSATTPAGEGATPLEPNPRSRRPLNAGWRFERGDPPGVTGLSYADAQTWV